VFQNVRIVNGEQLNEFEIIKVADYMHRHYPEVHYTMTPGNNCIWVYYGSINQYFIFRDGGIADIQID